MKTAIVSDIHSNIEALQECLKRVDEEGVDEIVSLGDIVGYNANPNECLDIIRERNVLSIMGNHDVCAAGLREPIDFNPIARDAILWTRRVLTAENNHFLTVLPDARRVQDRFLMVHGAVTHRDNYIFNEFDAYRLIDGRIEAFEESEDVDVQLDNASLWLVNPGSVGQPRDGDPRASFVTYDDHKKVVSYHRIDYDVPKSSRKVVNAGLPPQLGQRLLLGI